MISTTKASEEREVVRETWEIFQNGIFKTPGQSPQTKLLIYITSSKPSKIKKKVPVKTYKEKTEKHSLQQPGGVKTKHNGWPQEVHNHINTVTFLIT